MRTFVLAMFALAAGCGTSDPDAVWSPAVTQLTLSHGGGFVPPSKPTPECPNEGTSYTLVVASRALSAVSCTAASTPPYPLTKRTAARTLSVAELDTLVTKLEALRVVNVDTCGADKPEILVTTKTAAGTIEYGDSFYSCDKTDHRPKIDTETLDVAEAALGKLAFPTAD